MDKNIIRRDIFLTMDEYKNMKKYLHGNSRKVDVIKYFNGYDYEVFFKGISNNLLKLIVYNNSRSVIYEEIFSKISHLIGVKSISHQLNYKKNIIYININKEYDEIDYPLKSEFHKSKANILVWNIENDKESSFNEIVYADFTKDDDIVVAGYSLLLNTESIYDNDKSCKLFYDKLEFVGINVSQFNNAIDYSDKSEVINELNMCTSPKSVIFILLGLIEYLKTNLSLFKIEGYPTKDLIPAYDIYNKYFQLMDEI